MWWTGGCCVCETLSTVRTTHTHLCADADAADSYGTWSMSLPCPEGHDACGRRTTRSMWIMEQLSQHLARCSVVSWQVEFVDASNLLPLLHSCFIDLFNGAARAEAPGDYRLLGTDMRVLRPANNRDCMNDSRFANPTSRHVLITFNAQTHSLTIRRPSQLKSCYHAN